ncbi:uncharacterized protein F5Z01DRAFT_638214 [Emericellopsis atlantica]|uniref:Uncharacterized protein n=1 Tax=Emericellopsis atlantica TaxID=2614577 RepID=A0A9P8CN27_9HYPO|nr:uncharacterized protein F5Z01DRAFT_638214 [Emericellopsis atlantica]KAG9252717.1 hypothetical protein F5Z01DRAFT_638214 [Emericellopsis atlantica]
MAAPESKPAMDVGIYNVAWLAPRQIEALAAYYMLDELHRHRQPLCDEFSYIGGSMAGHNVVVVSLRGDTPPRSGSAAAMAYRVKRTFPNLQSGFLVGLAAGIPRRPPRPNDNTAAPIRSVFSSFRLMREEALAQMLHNFRRIEDCWHDDGTFAHPSHTEDQRYGWAGDQTAPAQLSSNPPEQQSRVFYGTIGSGSEYIRDSVTRNMMRDEHGVIAFEMEAAGVLAQLNVAVISGFCDFEGIRRSKVFQPYAAAMAASYARLVLSQLDANVHQEAALQGLPGTGKRQLALEGNDRTAMLRNVCQAIEKQRRWLVVVDNADDFHMSGLEGRREPMMANLYGFLPRSSTSTTIWLTHDLAVSRLLVGPGRTLKITNMTTEDAAKMVEKLSITRTWGTGTTLSEQTQRMSSMTAAAFWQVQGAPEGDIYRPLHEDTSNSHLQSLNEAISRLGRHDDFAVEILFMFSHGPSL